MLDPKKSKMTVSKRYTFAPKIQNPDESFMKFAESVDEEDNPIIIIAY